jgi:hypothetical protein
MGRIARDGDRDPLSDRNRNGRDGTAIEQLRWTGRVKGIEELVFEDDSVEEQRE